MVLSTNSPGSIPFGIGSPIIGVLEVLRELHDRERADGVPLDLSCWVSISIETDSLGR